MLDADLVAAVGAFHLDATLRDRDDVLAAVGISPAAGAVRLDGEGSVARELVDAAEAVFDSVTTTIPFADVFLPFA